MTPRLRELATERAFLLEVFLAFNLAFLALDVYLAHSANVFRHRAEWIPFVFTIPGAAVLAANLALSAPVRNARRRFDESGGFHAGIIVGVASVIVGTSGMLWHLESDFFEVMTLRSLVYSAPFVAPLAFTGLGLLALLNRLVPPRSLEWGRWITFLAWGGFVGNFVLSLLDHAQNGFFHATEWIPVGVAALVVGWLLPPAFRPTPPRYLRLALAVLGLASLTGIAGFALHLSPGLRGQAGTLGYRIVFGAPIFAPLLFPNLALLGALGVWDLLAKDRVSVVPAAEPEPS